MANGKFVKKEKFSLRFANFKYFSVFLKPFLVEAGPFSNFGSGSTQKVRLCNTGFNLIQDSVVDTNT